LGVSPLARQTGRILETALAAAEDDCCLLLVLGPAGEIRVIDGAGWSWEGLRSEYGPVAAYRVRRDSGRVVVEGMQGRERCRLERPLPLPAPVWR